MSSAVGGMVYSYPVTSDKDWNFSIWGGLPSEARKASKDGEIPILITGNWIGVTFLLPNGILGITLQIKAPFGVPVNKNKKYKVQFIKNINLLIYL